MDLTQTPSETRPAAAVSWEGRLARGFRLARVSWEVLASDRRLLALPLMAAVCALGALVATAALARRVHGGPELVHVIAPVWIATYLVSFTTIFFDVALVHVVVRRWQGEPAGLADGLGAAGRRLGAIAGWSVLTTTVGIALRLLERVTLGLSRLLVGIVAGAAWSVGSFFVVPALVAERQGPLRALRRSAGIVRGRWVEGGATPIGLATLLVALPVLGLLLMGCLLYVTGLTAVGMLAMAGAGVAFVVVCAVSNALTQVFTLAVFQHATGGPCFDGFPAGDLERPRDGGRPHALRRLRARNSSGDQVIRRV
jgi:hypothetical protein